MLEIFLFLNPISQVCLHTEAALLDEMRLSDHKMTVHFIPVVSLSAVDQAIQDRQIPADSLNCRNQLCRVAYRLALDYKAAQYQGNKKARAFLVRNQEHLAVVNYAYDAAFVQASLTLCGLDPETFYADRARPEVKDSFDQEQQMANMMGVTETPAMVIVDTDSRIDGGQAIRIDGITDADFVGPFCEELSTQPERFFSTPPSSISSSMYHRYS